jgi:tRNA dimethylallyltransferase
MHNITTIVGPTGTGKSQLGISLAQKYNGVILSADSRQVFKYADVGTNKYPLPHNEITTLDKHDGLWVVNGVNIYGYDVIAPDESFSVADYVEYGTDVIESIPEDRHIFIVGGTGFYIDALLGKMPYSKVKPDQKLRTDLRTEITEQLQNRLTKLDFAFASKMNESDRNNPQRLIRYIELATHAGSVEEAKEFSRLKRSETYPKIGLTADREVLDTRIEKWVKEIAGGELQKEVEQLLSKGYRDTPLLNGIIYQSMVEHVLNGVHLESTKEEISAQVKQYIRRQLTWFKRDKSIRWVDVSKDLFDRSVLMLLESNTEARIVN